MIRGLIFDLDGLLLDTEKLYNVFWKKACGDFGFLLNDKDALSLRSMSGENAEKRFKEIFGESFDYKAVRAHRINLMDEYIEQNGVEQKPYAKEFLSLAKQKGYVLSTATTSPYERAEKLLKKAEMFEYFDAFACGDMVLKSKPAPDIFLLAAKKLSLSPDECIGFEDSPNGIKACIAAGIKAVMIPDLSQPDDELKKHLYSLKTSLKDAAELLV